MEKGRLYCSRGNGLVWLKLDYFNVYGNNGRKGFMGDTLDMNIYPAVKFRITYNTGITQPIIVHLVRGGELLQTFKGETPMEVEYIDRNPPPGKMTYYRLIDKKKHLTSNPIFVTYNPSIPRP